MNTIHESELADNAKNNAIKKLQIVQNANAKYEILVDLTWKEGTFTLITTRGNPREWANLDRLARHISEYEGDPPLILLALSKPQLSH